ncbi:hypothetical protein AAZX31_12G111700 [Glycine max]
MRNQMGFVQKVEVVGSFLLPFFSHPATSEGLHVWEKGVQVKVIVFPNDVHGIERLGFVLGTDHHLQWRALEQFKPSQGFHIKSLAYMMSLLE